jgi:NTP pyrophosphatase (non-canonical NTP hydrolase)
VQRLTLGDKFERLVSAVQHLHDRNAQHKKGFRIAEISPDAPMRGALVECAEVLMAHATGDRVEIEAEMGDMLACFVHYAVMHGIDLSKVCTDWIRSIPEDFPGVQMYPPAGKG